MPSRLHAVSAVLIFSCAVSVGLCQPGAVLSGVVTDSQGAALRQASVTLTARDQSTSRVASSDSDGRYRFEFLAPGEYLVQAGAGGFAASGARQVTITNATPAVADFQLAPEAIRTQVVVTASSTAQTTDELSKSVSVVDSTAIELGDQPTITDALRYQPGLRIEQQGGPGGLVSIKTRGLRNQDTAVLIDGFRMRDAASPQGDATAFLQDLIVTDIDRIEVLQGAGSSLYGTDAIGGVVNIITGSGGGRTRGSFLAEGGSLDMFRGRAELAGGSRRVQYSVGLSHFNVLSGITGDAPDRTSSAQGRLDINLSAATHLFARMFAIDSFSKVNSVPEAVGNLPSIGIIPAVPGTGLQLGNANFVPDIDNPDSTRAARLFSGAVRLSTRLSDDLRFSVSYQGLLTRRRLADGPAGLGSQDIGDLFYDGDIHTATARVDWRLGKHQLIDAGYEFEDERYGNHSLMPSPADNSAVDVSQQSHALFVQDQISLLGDRLQLAASYRAQLFSLEQPVFAPAASAPYAGMRFPAPPAAQTGDGSAAWFFRRTGTKIRAHAGRGYRAPSLYERFGTFFDAFDGYFAFGNPLLHPDRSISLDAGIDQSLWNGRARLSATYFYTRLQEVVAFGFTGYLNTNGGLARGAETSAALALTRSTNLLASYTYTKAQDRTPLVENVIRTLIIPDHQVSVSATQRIGRRFTAVFNLLATSNYLAPLTNFTTFAIYPFQFPGKRLAELGGSYRIPLGDYRAIRFFGKASNVFDQNYYESGYRTPGATGTGGVQFEF